MNPELKARTLPTLLCALLAVTAARAEDWPNFRGPNHDGTTSERITAAWPLKELWTANVGAGYAETVVVSGRLYSWGWRNGTSTVYCLNPETGAQIWSQSNPFNPIGNHQAQCSTLTVSGGKIYAMGRESTLYCYDAMTGKELWERDINKELGFQCFQSERGESSSPVIEGNLILFCFGSGGAALNKDTGAKVWCNGTSGASFCTAYVYNSGKDRIAAMQIGGGVGVNVATGEVVWQFPHPPIPGFSCSDLIVAGDKVLYSSGYYNSSNCLAYTLGKGNLTPAWDTGVLGSRSSPNVLYNGCVYGCDGNAFTLVCMDAQTGAQMWKQAKTKTSAYDEYTGVIVAGGRLILVPRNLSHGNRGNLILADASPSGYREIHSQEDAVANDGVANVFRPSIAEGKLYVRNCAGGIACFDAKGTPAAPVFTSATSATGNVGAAFAYQIETTDDPTAFGATGQPAGLAMNTNTGLLSGTPTAGGTFSATLSATNAAGTSKKTLALNINTAPLPVITSAASAWGPVGIPFLYQIVASGKTTEYTATGLPPNLSVNRSTGVISGMPAATGTSTVALSATGPGGSGSATLVLTIGNAIFVDGNWSGAGTGAANSPFNTIKAGVDAANASSGMTVVVAKGVFKSKLSGGKEDFGPNGITMANNMTIRGGYAGFVSGANFDWVTRAPRSTDIDLAGASTRAFYSSGSNLALTIEGFTIRNGKAAGGGGAIKSEHNNYTTLNLADCLFTNNTATTEDGGAVVATGQYTPTYIINCDFINNHAPSAALVGDGRGGRGGRGGGLFVELQFGSQSTLTNCTFKGNSCGRLGGAMATDLHNARAVSLTVENCVFESNTSAKDGGAVFTGDGWGNTLTFKECVFRGNSAAAGGAAVGGTEYWQGDYNLVNCLITGNKGNYAVMNDGWRSDGPALDINHCTIVGNPGGGVFCNPHDVSAGLRIRNSIIANNGATGISYVRGKLMAAVLTHNDVVGQMANYAGDTAAGAGCISADPRFASPSTQNYQLTASSPCKDTAADIGIHNDLSGAVRPQGAGCDMGAFEFGSAAATGEVKR